MDLTHLAHFVVKVSYVTEEKGLRDWYIEEKYTFFGL